MKIYSTSSECVRVGMHLVALYATWPKYRVCLNHELCIILRLGQKYIATWPFHIRDMIDPNI